MSPIEKLPQRNGKRPARGGRAALLAVRLHAATRTAAPAPALAAHVTATDALTGQQVTLSLEGPDSNA
jgi:hypothetical protein